MLFTPEQKAAVSARCPRLLVSAAAGSGKTAVLIQRIASLLQSGEASVDRLLVCTFTRAAAGEMRERLQTRLADAAADQPRLRRELDKLDTAQIGTLHSFCGRVTREFFHAVEVDPQAAICDDVTAANLLSACAEESLDEAYAAHDPDFDALAARCSDRELQAMLPQLYHFLMGLPDPFAWLDEQLAQEPAAQIANDSALSRTLREDCGVLLSGAEAFWRQARDLAANPICPDKLLPLLEDDGGLLLRLRDALEAGLPELIDTLACLRFGRFPSLRLTDEGELALKAEIQSLREGYKKLIEQIKKRLPADASAAAADMEAMRPALRGLAALARSLHEKLRLRKRERALLTFEDTEHMALAILRDPELAQIIRRRYDAVFVDEYQDVSALQDAILTALCGDTLPLFMVGDVKQSIYRFRQAEPALFLDKLRRYSEFPDAAERRISLNRNFRSRENVLHSVNAVFERVMRGEVAEIDYDDDARLYAGLPSVDDPPTTLHVLPSAGVRAAQKPGVEARLIAEEIRRVVDTPRLDREGHPDGVYTYRDIAILAPVGKGVSAAVTRALTDANIPVYSEESAGVMQQDEVLQALAHLRVMNSRLDDLNLLAVLRGPAFGLTGQELADIRLRRPHKDASYLDALLAAAGESGKGAAGADAAGADVASDAATLCADVAGAGVSGAGISGAGALGTDVSGTGALGAGASDERAADADVLGAASLGTNVSEAASSGAGALGAGVLGTDVSAEALPSATAAPDDALAARCREIVATLQHERFLLTHQPMGAYLWGYLHRSGMYGYYGAQPGGKLRQANLRLLCHRLDDWERQRGGDLSDFLDSVTATGGVEDRTTPAVLSPWENVVRVMTIHKSKGLEFPIVFLMDMGRALHRAGDAPTLSLHPRVGMALRYVNPSMRVKRQTLGGAAVALRQRAEETAERARLLYVAMTRARDQLILVGHMPRKRPASWTLANTPYRVWEANSMLDWLCQTACDLGADPALVGEPQAAGDAVPEMWISGNEQQQSTEPTSYAHQKGVWSVVFHNSESDEAEARQAALSALPDAAEISAPADASARPAGSGSADGTNRPAGTGSADAMDSRAATNHPADADSFGAFAQTGRPDAADGAFADTDESDDPDGMDSADEADAPIGGDPESARRAAVSARRAEELLREMLTASPWADGSAASSVLTDPPRFAHTPFKVGVTALCRALRQTGDAGEERADAASAAFAPADAARTPATAAQVDTSTAIFTQTSSPHPHATDTRTDAALSTQDGAAQTLATYVRTDAAQAPASFAHTGATTAAFAPADAARTPALSTSSIPAAASLSNLSLPDNSLLAASLSAQTGTRDDAFADGTREGTTEETPASKRLPLPVQRPRLLSDLPSLPAFLRAPDEQTGLRIGVSTHKALSLLPFEPLRAALADGPMALRAAVRAELDALAARRLLTPQERADASDAAIAGFYASELGRRALASAECRREWAFNLRVREPIDGVVQGVIDLCFREGDGWVLVDYKTDRVSGAEALAPRYRAQVGYYRRALASATGLPVREAALYSLHCGRATPV